MNYKHAYIFHIPWNNNVINFPLMEHLHCASMALGTLDLSTKLLSYELSTIVIPTLEMRKLRQA